MKNSYTKKNTADFSPRILIIPGFTSYPENLTYNDLLTELKSRGHDATVLPWPFLPDDLDKYSLTSTLDSARKTLEEIKTEPFVILGFSMGGIIATELAVEFPPAKLGLIESSYQAGTEDDLAEKLDQWQKQGFLTVMSSKFGELKMPYSFIEDARKYNALDNIGKISCPKLFIAGDKDDTVPWKVTRKLFDKAIEPKEWHLVKGMTHKYKHQPEVLKEVNELIIDFVCL